MTPVIIESPYAGDVSRNVLYATRLCLAALEQGLAPIASHLLYTQFLDDSDELQRDLGIRAGLAWRKVASHALFGVDYGWSRGMTAACGLYSAEGIVWHSMLIGQNHEDPKADSLLLTTQRFAREMRGLR